MDKRALSAPEVQRRRRGLFRKLWVRATDEKAVILSPFSLITQKERKSQTNKHLGAMHGLQGRTLSNCRSPEKCPRLSAGFCSQQGGMVVARKA